MNKEIIKILTHLDRRAGKGGCIVQDLADHAKTCEDFWETSANQVNRKDNFPGKKLKEIYVSLVTV